MTRCPGHKEYTCPVTEAKNAALWKDRLGERRPGPAGVRSVMAGSEPSTMHSRCSQSCSAFGRSRCVRGHVVVFTLAMEPSHIPMSLVSQPRNITSMTWASPVTSSHGFRSQPNSYGSVAGTLYLAVVDRVQVCSCRTYVVSEIRIVRF